ncbi:S8 family peptidase [[Clostridium] scindens]|uniref:S8 family peptidase n=1 Tax=Clostridium scindens (strain JCM 10418 / VPI 12708) TaxID=29347 RepID=UPI001D092A66|nr:S8 family serine peptidase [[Clostridium] scindens]MCB6284477.1 S8 family serine peptidase [[Clostridium] scindens]MCB6423084.1 S8 family serine peptidase [[Clostridium] scindens]MCB7191036.1 S8 family serine peptidase [[Clostridium] scindens]MCB7287948.1 S8 family serine peptidase [[Clostridium] scindens]MCQ5285720.1 S8 family serine peptidase [[Clostridium] scindens]
MAVLDTGCQMDHPDLEKVLNKSISVEITDVTQDGYSTVPLEGDDSGHGTHVCGIVSAQYGNGMGIAGVGSGMANDIVDLFAVDVFINEKTSTAQVVAGLNYALYQGAQVINMSIGATVDNLEQDGLFKSACEYAKNQGCAIVSAAGNIDEYNTNPLAYTIPSDWDSTISVINTDENNLRNSSSFYGSMKDVSAPGTYIYSTYPNSAYVFMSGTSMALQS